MKKRSFKEKFKENLGDAILELILTLILFAVGAGLIAFFGIEIDYETMDSDLIVLIGFGALAAVGALIAAVVVLIKRSRKGKKFSAAAEENTSLEENENEQK